MKLTNEQKKKIKEAGKAELTLSQLAIILNFNETELQMIFSNEESEIYRIYEAARIESYTNKINILNEKAEQGDIQALKAIERLKFQEEKRKIFGV